MTHSGIEAYRRRTRLQHIIGFAILVATVIALALGIFVGIRLDTNAKDTCRKAGYIVSEIKHGDGWVCIDREGRIVEP